MIVRSEWYWGGYAGHFIGSANCRFHLSSTRRLQWAKWAKEW